MKNKKLQLIIGIVLIITMTIIAAGFTSTPVKKISLSSDKITLKVGQTFVLKPTITPSNATNKTLIFASSDKKIATVDIKGKITAVKAGKATVTVSSSDKKVSVKCYLTITALPVVELKVSRYAINTDNVEAQANDRIKKLLENKFNVKLTYHSGFGDEYFQKLNVAMNAGDAPDIFATDVSRLNTEFKKWVENGMISDMGNMVNKEPVRYKVLKKLFNDTYYKMYNDTFLGDPKKTMGLYALQYSFGMQGMPFINGKYLKNLKLKPPETFDDFISMLRAFKTKDPDKNGKNDTIPYSFENAKFGYWGNFNNLFFTTHGTYMSGFHQDKDGKWYDAAVADKTKKVWKLVAGYYKEGLIDPEIGVKDDWTQTFPEFWSGKLASMCMGGDSELVYTIWYNSQLKKANPDATLDDWVLPPHAIKGPDGFVKNETVTQSVYYIHVIPKTCKNPDRALDILNYICSDEGQDLINLGIKGVHYTKGSDGKIVVNKEQWKTEADIPYKYEGIYKYPFFSYVANSAEKYVQLETAQDWPTAIKEARDFMIERKGNTPEYEYSHNIIQNYIKESLVELPPYYGLVTNNEEESKIQAKLDDILKKYGAAFLVGQKNVDSEWSDFVREYKNAGSEKLMESYIKKIGEAKKKFESYQK